ncbi:family 43 glycosylhydrolase [Pelagicoccus albus]|uniref:Family 43 glycosylhydrolase n=1 Tax=Pelagicoccus albus TaxID=415222 RepID=A0A7X1B5Q4_9BACT|nr:family 43 glycosylhydrolase [Pelagicoccus albus]MBC2606102.1 family 43 glycosylhydrolase [Pelagicoccus albus]
MIKLPSFIFFFLCLSIAQAELIKNSLAAIHSGIAWYDDQGDMVSAHGAGIIKDGDRFYLFGEFKNDGGNEFSGFSCYSSTDLVNWTFENIALPVQKEGRLGPNTVGERPKVMKCPSTGEYVMYMHTDDIRYKDPAVGYATSDRIDGEFTFQGILEFDGNRIRKWDMGIFQDDDGIGYLITHSGNLYRLSDDYKSVDVQIVENMTQACESPVIFKRDGLYYWIGSGLTAWERNDNYYFTATDLRGPWKEQGHFAPEGSLTWNSQCTYVLPIVGSKTTTYMYMGDRWAHPRQNSAATYVWQPLVFDNGKITLPEYQQSWQVNTSTGEWTTYPLKGKAIDPQNKKWTKLSGSWEKHTDAEGFSDLRSNQKGDTLSLEFSGTQVGFYSVARSDGGFGKVEIMDRDGNIVLTTIVETYCRYTEESLKFLSPKLEDGDYTLTLTVLGERFFWQAKTTTWGSSDDYVSVSKFLISH